VAVGSILGLTTIYAAPTVENLFIPSNTMPRKIVKQRELTLINSLAHGDQQKIAKICRCANTYVSSILGGHVNQNSALGQQIMRLARHFAERNVARNAVKQYRDKQNG
jgi:hypothetical protein